MSTEGQQYRDGAEMRLVCKECGMEIGEVHDPECGHRSRSPYVQATHTERAKDES